MRVHATIQMLILMSALFGLSIVANASDGKVCVQKIPSGPTSSWKGNDTGATERNTFSVRIDDLPVISVTTNSSGLFTNLSLIEKHLVTIRLENKPLTSFRFSFDGRAHHLRLWYNEFYGTWSLSDVRVGEKCECSRSLPTNKGAASHRSPTG